MSNKRSRLFVDRAFQGRLLLRLVIYWVIYHIALWHVMFLLNLIGAGMNADSTVPSRSFWSLYREFAVEHTSVIVCFVVMLPILGRDLLKFSHRLAGPLVRFRNTMGAMASGERVQTINLRDGDLLTEFVASFNSMVQTWNRRVDKPSSVAQPDAKREFVESTN